MSRKPPDRQPKSFVLVFEHSITGKVYRIPISKNVNIDDQCQVERFFRICKEVLHDYGEGCDYSVVKVS